MEEPHDLEPAALVDEASTRLVVDAGLRLTHARPRRRRAHAAMDAPPTAKLRRQRHVATQARQEDRIAVRLAFSRQIVAIFPADSIPRAAPASA